MKNIAYVNMQNDLTEMINKWKWEVNEILLTFSIAIINEGMK